MSLVSKLYDELLEESRCKCDWPSQIHCRLRGMHCQKCGKSCPNEVVEAAQQRADERHAEMVLAVRNARSAREDLT